MVIHKKAWLIAWGFLQVQGVNYFDMFVPITWPSSICTIATTDPELVEDFKQEIRQVNPWVTHGYHHKCVYNIYIWYSCSHLHCPSPHSCVLSLLLILCLLPFMLSWPSFVPGPHPCSCCPGSHSALVHADLAVVHIFTLPLLLFMPTPCLCVHIAPALICVALALVHISPSLVHVVLDFICPWPPFILLLLSFMLTQLSFMCLNCPAPVHAALALVLCICATLTLIHVRPPCIHALPVVCNLVWPLFMHFWACLSVSNT